MTFVITRPRPGPNKNTVCGKLQPPHTNRLKDSAGSAVRSLFLLGRTAPSAPRVRVRNQQQKHHGPSKLVSRDGELGCMAINQQPSGKSGLGMSPGNPKKRGRG